MVDLRDNQRGFTFMEMLVATFVFIIIMVTALDLFLSIQRAQRASLALEKLQADVRFSMNAMAQDVREGVLDYSSYENAAVVIDSDAGNEQLYVRGFDGSVKRYELSTPSTEGNCPADSIPCLLVSDDDGVTWHSMTGEGTVVDALAFYIVPDGDPLVFDEELGDFPSDLAPRVRIVFTASARVYEGDRPVRLSVQTTISSREYVR